MTPLGRLYGEQRTSVTQPYKIGCTGIYRVVQLFVGLQCGTAPRRRSRHTTVTPILRSTYRYGLETPRKAVVLDGYDHLVPMRQIYRHGHTVTRPLTERDALRLTPSLSVIIRAHHRNLLFGSCIIRGFVGKVKLYVTILKLQCHRFPATFARTASCAEYILHTPRCAAVIRHGTHDLVFTLSSRTRTRIPQIQQSAAVQLQKLRIGVVVSLIVRYFGGLAPAIAAVDAGTHTYRRTGTVNQSQPPVGQNLNARIDTARDAMQR